MKESSPLQGDLFNRVHEITPEEREAHHAAYEKMMAERQARYDAVEEARKDAEAEPGSGYPWPLEVVAQDGLVQPAPGLDEWRKRMDQRRQSKPTAVGQSTLDLWPDQPPQTEGSRTRN